MTKFQENNEKASVEQFVVHVINQVRPMGTNAAVMLVLLAAARAAAEAATRDKNGVIEYGEAADIFYDAALMMRRFKKEKK